MTFRLNLRMLETILRKVIKLKYQLDLKVDKLLIQNLVEM